MLIPEKILFANEVLCKRISFSTGVKIKKIHCIGHTLECGSIVKVYLDKNRDRKNLIKTSIHYSNVGDGIIGKTLFILNVMFSSFLIRNEPYLYYTYVLSDKERKSPCLKAKLYFLVENVSLERFVNNIYNKLLSKGHVEIDYLFKYGTIVLTQLYTEHVSYYKFDEYSFLKDFVELDAEFIFDKGTKSSFRYFVKSLVRHKVKKSDDKLFLIRNMEKEFPNTALSNVSTISSDYTLTRM